MGNPAESDNVKIERLKAYANVATVLITVIFGTTAVTIINSSFQQRQLEQQKLEHAAQLQLQKEKAEADRRQAEMKYLGDYLQFALEQDVERRIRFAEYFSSLTVSTDLRENWKAYLARLLTSAFNANQLEVQLQEATQSGNTKKAEELSAALALLQSQITDIRPRTAPSVAAGNMLVTRECKQFPELTKVVNEISKPHGFQDSISWRLTADGIEVSGRTMATPEGLPVVAERVWRDFGAAIRNASAKHRVPVELLIADIVSESGGNAGAISMEPGYVSDASTPHRILVGLTQLLISTAREITGNPNVDRNWMLNPANAIDASAAYISRQASITGFDPPKVAAAKNAGTLVYNNSSANVWRMRSYPIGTGFAIDRFVRAFGDAMKVIKSSPDIPTHSFSACINSNATAVAAGREAKISPAR